MTSAIVVVNWNSMRRLYTCIQSALEAETDAEIAVVDNASEDGSLEALENAEFGSRVMFIRNDSNRGLAAGVNQGFTATTAPYVLMLNPDVRVTGGAVPYLEKFMDTHPRAGAIGGFVNDRYGPRQLPTRAALISENLGMSGKRGQLHRGAEPRLVDQPAAAAILIRREAYDAVGGFDEQFYPAWYEDVDFCCRLKAAGWEIYFAPEAEFIHEGGYSAKAMGATAFAGAYYRNQLRYAQKHFGGGRQLAVRLSMAVGMAVRIVLRPSGAPAFWNVIRGALGAW